MLFTFLQGDEKIFHNQQMKLIDECGQGEFQGRKLIIFNILDAF